MPYIDIDKKYKCIVADPPWKYYNTYATSPTRTSNGMTGASTKYPVLDLEEIKQLNVPDIVDDEGCVLFLWATMPLLRNGIEVLDAWGFNQKTALVWVKTNWLGMGKWFRVNTEICFVGIRGKVRAFNNQTPNVIYAQPTRHSRKPEEFWEKIEPIIFQQNLMPCIDLFARYTRPNWDAWGLEANHVESQ
jgi:N6-adenosine-specific RNA methylase IME4